jgi:hypothetical protein
VTCGKNPVAVLDDKVTVILRRGEYIVEGGRRAVRCPGCMEKEKSGRKRRTHPAETMWARSN